MITLFVVYWILVSLNPNFQLLATGLAGKWLKGWVLRGLIALVPSFLIIYFGMPSTAGPLGGSFGLAVVFGMLVNLVISWMTNANRAGNRYRYDDSVGKRASSSAPWGVVPVGLAVLAIFGAGILSRPLFQSAGMAKMIGTVPERLWSDDMHPVDTEHIRMVGEEQAAYYASKVLTTSNGVALGSMYFAGDQSMQRVGNKLESIAPLEFVDVVKWARSDGTPGFTVVNAENRSEAATLHMTKKDGSKYLLNYMPSAYFGFDLIRHLYSSGYTNVDLVDPQFELDDDYKPWWVVTETVPTLMYTGTKVVGVLLVDPETGDIHPHGLNDLPPWVDRAIPSDVAIRYVNWWGTWSTGWWNGFTGKNTFKATDEGATLVWGSDGQAYWYTGLTSTNNKEQTQIGYVLINSRTGATVRYEGKAPAGTEDAAVHAMDQSVRNFPGYHATKPVPYNINDEMAYVAPILSEGHLFQRIAICRASTMEVVLGETKEAALHEFQRLLVRTGNSTAPSNTAKTGKVEGKVARIGSDTQGGNTTWYLELEGNDHIFAATYSPKTAPELPVLKTGDAVFVTFIDQGEKTTLVETIEKK